MRRRKAERDIQKIETFQSMLFGIIESFAPSYDSDLGEVAWRVEHSYSVLFVRSEYYQTKPKRMTCAAPCYI